MSQPSTPSRLSSERVSAASTPSEHRDLSPMQLTPRSKVRAMLAAWDDDFDAPTLPGRETLGSNSDPRPTESQRTGEVQYDDSDPDTSEESAGDDAALAPKGRLAARLLGQRTSKEIQEGGEEMGRGNAYERVRRQFLLRRKTERVISEASVSLANGSSEGEEGPTRVETPRRRKPAIIESDSSGTPHRSQSSHRASSPGLFVPPEQGSPSRLTGQATEEGTSDYDLPSDPLANPRLFALVARKKEERQLKQTAEAQKKSEREAQSRIRSNKKSIRHTTPTMGLLGDTSEDDAVGERKLTQQARPTRKASKKALEEMNRETQRMSRNMQLAHQAKTKKKITKESLFARFSFRTVANPAVSHGHAMNSSTTASSAYGSDAVPPPDNETPPTSPASLGELSQQEPGKMAETASAERIAVDMDDELPSMEEIMSQPIRCLDKGIGKVTEELAKAVSDQRKNKNANKIHPAISIHVRSPQGLPLTKSHDADVDTDSDLEIIPAAKNNNRITDIFDRLPAQSVTEGRSLQILRALAHLTSPSKQGVKARASMTSAEMQVSLQRRARQQAAQERAEKLQELEDRGIIVQTAEERERDQAEIEDLLEKARREGDEIMKREKVAAKKEKRENGEDDGLGDSSEEDEDYQDDEVDGPGDELSGSEEEDVDGDSEEDENVDDADDEEDGAGGVPVEGTDEEDEAGGVPVEGMESGLGDLIDQEAREGGLPDMHDDGIDKEEEEPELNIVQNIRRSKATRVIHDEDDEDSDDNVNEAPAILPEAARNPLIAGLPMSDRAPMGLTQAFAATMAETQTQSFNDGEMIDCQAQEQDSLTLLGHVPEPDIPMLDIDAEQELIADSQGGKTQDYIQATSIMPEIDIHYSQSQVRYDTLKDTEVVPTLTQYSDIPDPTQDVGFGMSSPIAGRFVSAPPSTQDTVLLSGVPRPESPVVKKKGRLRRRTEAVPVLSDVDEDDASSEHAEDDFEISANAFDIMKNAGRRAAPAQYIFDKKKSDAKGMVEEQAEESEDEYAGLGGASDDESAAEEDEEVRKMIDEGEVKVDERKLAAFYA